MDTNENVTAAMLPVTEVRAGDVLLCNCGANCNAIQKGLQRQTGSAYVHAAIYVGDAMVGEAVRAGVQRVSLADLVARYDHIAVFRSALGWGPERVQKLKTFVDQEVTRKARYNFLGALKVPRSMKAHAESIDAQLREFFSQVPDSKKKAVFFGRKRYFCSEFVARCFVEAGLIDASGQVFFNPRVQSPGALGRDWVYGVLVGFISDKPNYTVSAEDEFYRDPTYHEIFLDEQ